ncbi:MAG: U32 family peptidase [Kiloniellales bacterium]
MTAGAAKLTLGPLLFNWPAEARRDFYFRVAEEAPVDSVCLGEVVCAKRAPFFAPYLPEVTARLERAGKEVVHSTPALVTGEAERAALRDLAAEPDRFIEANDVACLGLIDARPHAIGPFVNVYNEGTLAYLARRGAARVTLTFDLSRDSMQELAKAAGPVELEVQVFGRTPLAISARCYHARAHGLHKNSCQYVCADDPDGMGLDSLDSLPFLAVNGTQTLSYTIGNLVAELDELRAMGIGRFRLSPQQADMVAVAETFRAVLDRRQGPAEAAARLAELTPFAPFANGFYHGRPGMALVGGDMAQAE